MTKAAPLVPDIESRRRWISDDEAAELYCVPRDAFRRVCMVYDADKKSGFPPKHFILKMRWLPALDDFFDATNKPKIVSFGGTGS